MNPKVSICIPTYNRKDYLKETLDSIFSQTYKDYEIVIVDDGSTDGTEEMIKKCGKTIRYYWQKNAGDAATKNNLVELSNGKFITLIDSDDLLVPDAVERMVNAIESQSDEVIVYGPYIRIDANGKNFGRCERKLYSGFVTRYLFENIFVHSCGSMCSKKIFLELGGRDESLKVCSDYEFWLRASLKYRFIALPEPTFKRRRHMENLSKVSSQNCLTELQVLERFYYEKGGDKIVPRNVAMRRLSREEYRVAKSALAERNFTLATDYFHRSFSRFHSLKTLIFWGISVLRRPDIK